jgi:hypothetical protein
MHNGKIKKVLVCALSIAGALYIGWNGRNVLLGPRIDVLFPKNGETFETHLIDITGKAKNASFLSLNDKEIYVDKSGYFQEEMALLPGMNVIKIGSRDRFGETEEKILHIYFKGEDLDYNNL